MAKIFINEKNKKGQIHPEIYGHFSEHLGRCIYEGLYVGENSDIPNVNGMRSDVVEALKEMQIPVLRWPGGRADYRAGPRGRSCTFPGPGFYLQGRYRKRSGSGGERRFYVRCADGEYEAACGQCGNAFLCARQGAGDRASHSYMRQCDRGDERTGNCGYGSAEPGWRGRLYG